MKRKEGKIKRRRKEKKKKEKKKQFENSLNNFFYSLHFFPRRRAPVMMGAVVARKEPNNDLEKDSNLHEGLEERGCACGHLGTSMPPVPSRSSQGGPVPMRPQRLLWALCRWVWHQVRYLSPLQVFCTVRSPGHTGTSALGVSRRWRTWSPAGASGSVKHVRKRFAGTHPAPRAGQDLIGTCWKPTECSN